MSRERTYPSDCSDAEWAILEPLVPEPRSGTPAGGRPVVYPRRDVVDGIAYVVRTGCAWRQLPADFPPWETIYAYFAAWAKDGTLAALHDALRDQVRACDGREASATAGVLDAQSVKGADTVGATTRGFDAGKRTNGRKRHIVVDTTGLLFMVIVTAASVQDRDGGRSVIEKLASNVPGVRHIWADGGYAGKLVSWATETLSVVVEIVKKKEGQRGFEVLPRRWVVERTFSWITKCRRLACDYERTIAHSEAMVCWAMVGLMARRLARDTSGDVTPYNWV
jgi:transposase